MIRILFCLALILGGAAAEDYLVKSYEGPGVVFGTFHSDGYTVIDKYALDPARIEALLVAENGTEVRVPASKPMEIGAMEGDTIRIIKLNVKLLGPEMYMFWKAGGHDAYLLFGDGQEAPYAGMERLAYRRAIKGYCSVQRGIEVLKPDQ
ncbi:MAG TPA: hypothetical protein VN455_11040 [Methanotrichaceae archaeon]|nr:hypothetical protein [Methanotrichaceae archaeon]